MSVSAIDAPLVFPSPRLHRRLRGSPNAIFHRGTGYSHRLTCSQQDIPSSNNGFYLAPENVGACLGELRKNGDYDRLPYFTARQAAEDLAEAISATRTPDQKVYVWGGSYGTHWAHRFLQVAPNLADGIIFDGYLTPGKFGFVDFDKGAEEAGERFATGCAADASCTAHMGPAPEAHVKQILDRLATTPCAGIDRDGARAWATSFLDEWATRAFVFPFLHRLERCSADDITALNHLVQTWSAATSAHDVPTQYTSSGILLYNIALSELWGGGDDLTDADFNAAADAQTWLNGSSLPGAIADLRGLWPLPPADASDLPVPVTGSKTKLLWLSGSLDLHTPSTQAAAVSQIYPGATIVALPGAAHIPSQASPMLPYYTQNCGFTLAESFMTNDGAADTSCIAQMAPVWYQAPNAQWASYWWGTGDDWGDGTPATSDGFAPPVSIVTSAHSSAFAP